MILTDNKTDSLLVYCDWLIDIGEEEVAELIREGIGQIVYQHWHSEIGGHDFVGCISDDFVGGSHGGFGGRSVGSYFFLGSRVGAGGIRDIRGVGSNKFGVPGR